MLSEPIANHRSGRSRSLFRVPPRRMNARYALVAGMIAVVLTGCAEGTSRDAERARQDDAERTSVVDAFQATSSANLVRKDAEATPPATQTAPTEEVEGN